MQNIWLKLTFGAVALVLVLQAASFARGTLADGGALEPPGGPAPGMKSLQEVEPRTPISSLPYTINQPGSYYLTGNLTAGSDVVGITVNAYDVTLDLNGFRLRGLNSANSTTAGIYSYPSTRNLSISNGTVSGWRIGIDTSQGSVGTLRDLTVTENGCNGVVAGAYFDITRIRAVFNENLATDCSGVSIVTGPSSVTASQVSGNQADGVLLLGNQSVVRDNILEFNNGAAVRDEAVSSVVAGNRIASNGYHLYALNAAGLVFVQNQLTGGAMVPGGLSYAPLQSPPNVTNPWANIAY